MISEEFVSSAVPLQNSARAFRNRTLFCENTNSQNLHGMKIAGKFLSDASVNLKKLLATKSSFKTELKVKPVT